MQYFYWVTRLAARQLCRFSKNSIDSVISINESSLIGWLIGRSRSYSTMPFYAVRKGRRIGIYETWAECEAQVKQFTGAQFKKFSTREDAVAFIGGTATAVINRTVTSASGLKRKRNPESGETSADSSATTEAEAETKRHRSSDSGDSTVPSTVVYTDGACVNNGYSGAKGGIGVYWGLNDPRNVSEPLPAGRQTNNRAEILACARAIEQASQSGVKRLEIRTDSQFTISCITEWLKTWKRMGWRKRGGGPVLNMEELQILDEKKRKYEEEGGEIIFTHVYGHVGVPGNEAADRLAVEGAAKR